MSKLKIGFYAGSFNPFHIGHWDILSKAEKIFEKVIIGVGLNHEKKGNKRYELPAILHDKEVIKYDGLITDVIEDLSKRGEVFMIRGLRNQYDFQSEDILRKSVNDFIPDTNFVYLFCDKGNEHISSSLIRDILSRKSDDDNYIAKYCLEDYREV